VTVLGRSIDIRRLTLMHLIGVHLPYRRHLMGAYLMSVHLIGVYLTGRVSHGRVPHGRASRRRAPHGKANAPGLTAA
jgi:hypothetical protein